jgi:hypothetical protein
MVSISKIIKDIQIKNSLKLFQHKQVIPTIRIIDHSNLMMPRSIS